MLQFEEQLKQILKIYKDGNSDPLNGDEVEDLTQIIYAQLDLLEGNITEEEYQDRLDISTLSLNKENTILVKDYLEKICEETIAIRTFVSKDNYSKQGVLKIDDAILQYGNYKIDEIGNTVELYSVLDKDDYVHQAMKFVNVLFISEI